MSAIENSDEKVILVNEQDEPIGSEEKLKAHIEGKLHRAISVFIFRPHEHGIQLLLQKRSMQKYHSAGLWSNTCCSHPRPGEDTAEAANRRLMEEMGMTDIYLQHRGSFTYKATFQNSLTEYEVDHVYVGFYNGESITPNPEEVMDYTWMGIQQFREDLSNQPNRYSVWLPKALSVALDK